MISRITLSNIATFSDVSFNPKQINYIFGSNGCGKSTVCSAIASNVPDSRFHIEKDASDKVFVFNDEFKKSKFGSGIIPGVFTFGGNKDLTELIADLNTEIKNEKENCTECETTITNLENDLNNSEEQFMTVCWNVQKYFRSEIGNDIFPGYKNNRKKFASECIVKYDKIIDKLSKEGANPTIDHTQNVDIVSLKNKCALTKTKSLSYMETLSEIKCEGWVSNNIEGLLKKRIVGSSGVPITEFIGFLNNSDWINKGLFYLAYNENRCPFCNRTIDESFVRELNDYFDESYTKDCGEIKLFLEAYDDLISVANANIESYRGCNFFDPNSVLSVNIIQLEKICSSNRQLIEDKIENPSKKITLGPVIGLIEKINSDVKLLNVRIDENNKSLSNSKKALSEFDALLWESTVLKLPQIEGYKQKKKTMDDNIKAQKDKLNGSKTIIKKDESKISELQKSMESVVPTVDFINNVLEECGYTGFRLVISPDDPTTYSVIRDNGDVAVDTLSEGERNILCLLYFYKLIKEHSKANAVNCAVFVFDDPVSSLDGSATFLVSSIIHSIFDELKNQKDTAVKDQLFVFTHNLHFYLEITNYRKHLKDREKTKIMYAVISKKENYSKIDCYGDNPITSVYESLWESIKNDNMDGASVLNNMRRILQNYLSYVNRTKIDKCIEEMSDEADKLACDSLLRFANQSSHSVFDDVAFSPVLDDIGRYKRVFKQMFTIMGGEDHYNTMMGIESNLEEIDSPPSL